MARTSFDSRPKFPVFVLSVQDSNRLSERTPEMNIQDMITWLMQTTKDHVDKGLCVKINTQVIPPKMCIKKAADGKFCCSQHVDECPIKGEKGKP